MTKVIPSSVYLDWGCGLNVNDFDAEGRVSPMEVQISSQRGAGGLAE